MYFQARPHSSLPVADAAEAVHRIHTGNIMDFQCPVWTDPGTGHLASPLWTMAT